MLVHMCLQTNIYCWTDRPAETGVLCVSFSMSEVERRCFWAFTQCRLVVLDFEISPCSECCMQVGISTCLWRWNRQSVPKRRHIKFRRQGITQKKAYNRLVVQPWMISNLMHKIFIDLHIIHLLKSSTCFEHYPAHLQEVYIVNVYMQPLVSSLSAGDCPVHPLRTKSSSFLTGAQDSHLQRVTIPEVAYIQLLRRPPEDGQGNARNM